MQKSPKIRAKCQRANLADNGNGYLHLARLARLAPHIHTIHIAYNQYQ